MLNTHSIGLGLRQEFLYELLEVNPKPIDFLEIAPENWIKIGGKRKKQFEAYTEKYPFVLHGLSLSIGGSDPLNTQFIKEVKAFMDQYHIDTYSEHLSYCSDQQGYIYDLLPIPFTEEAVEYVSKRIIQVQDIIERPLALENASYYAAPDQRLSEIDFIKQIIERTNCKLLLDVNNVYVNSVNHGYDPKAFIQQIPKDKIEYLHIAGHYQKAPDLIIDTHGAKIKDSVFDLLNFTYETHGVLPTLLERDFNIPPLPELLLETDQIKAIQTQFIDEVSSL
ncbi:DUF692 domain-containing protein [Francisellaceae bacterium]|nr:DUF692 domain-containing protein [Francisellaceae bacterium]